VGIDSHNEAEDRAALELAGSEVEGKAFAAGPGRPVTRDQSLLNCENI
jgi:hypothetical protein